MRQVACAVAVSLLLAALLSLPADAAPAGFDAEYVGETDFIELGHGGSTSFTVFFRNTGTVSWIKNTATQVDLAACLDDKVTCDRQDPSEAAFDPGTWLRPGRYAAQGQAIVAPGGVGAFSYAVKVPASAALGTYRFNGDLVLASTGEKIHPLGYYHELTVKGVACAEPVTLATLTALQQVQIGVMHEQRATLTCADGVTKAQGRGVTFSVGPGAADAGNGPLTLSATTDASGVATARWTRSNPGADTITVFPVSRSDHRITGSVRWTVAARVLTCEPSTSAEQGSTSIRVLTITARDPNTGALLSGGTLDIAVSTYVSFGTATISGVTAVGIPVGRTVIQLNTDSAGVGTIVVSGTSATIAPVVFLDEDASNSLGANEFRADCGPTTFRAF